MHPFCGAEFEKVAAIPLKPQLVVKTLDILHSPVMVVSPIPAEL